MIIVVLDSVGIGAMPDAAAFGDNHPDTLGHIAKAVGGISLPNLQQLGLGNIHPIQGIPPSNSPKASWGKGALLSHGKDTTTGHWEIAGIILKKGFKLYPNGFPPDLIKRFIESSGCKNILANKPASGTVIIQEYGEEHLKTKFPIVYTSADSVFQIAAHEEIIPVSTLYKWCEAAYTLCEEYHIARVIARPFVGEPGFFTRTERRKDFTVLPPKQTVLELLHNAGVQVTTVGKISDIFSGRGVTKNFNVKTNPIIMEETIRLTKSESEGLIFSNLVDFDMKYGHRRDPKGYADALKAFDVKLPLLLDALGLEDLLIITADHGCDPTHPGTDHTREYVPLLAFTKKPHKPHSLGIRQSLVDIGQTVAENFGLKLSEGRSFLPEVLPP
ncbi:MAG TPA: phosphopentomutase [Bdellovibrionota bacterium]|nr:phosphopentomutase [Bdellovibrionota bacterium]